MFHGYAWATYGDQRGPRSNKQGCLTSMAIAEASRDLAPGTRLDLQTMLSLDPLMGARPMQRLIQDTIRRALADELLFGRLVDGGRLTVDIDDKEDKTTLPTLAT